MTESVILGSPVLVLLLGLSFLMQLVFIRIGVQGILHMLPAALCTGSLVWAVWLGSSLEELSVVLCAFFMLCLAGCGGRKK